MAACRSNCDKTPVQVDESDDFISDESDSFLENLDVTTDEGQQQMIDRLLALESEIEDAQEMLEAEGIDNVTNAVRAELIENDSSVSSEDLEARVSEEMQEYVRRWTDNLEELEEQRSMMQDQLQALGIHLRSIYQMLEPVTAKKATTSVWREAARPNLDLSEQAATAQLSADAELERSSLVVYRNGEAKRGGASGFLERRMNEMLEAPPKGADGWYLLSRGIYQATYPIELEEHMQNSREALLVDDLCIEDDGDANAAMDRLSVYQTRVMRQFNLDDDLAKEKHQEQKDRRRLAKVKRARKRRDRGPGASVGSWSEQKKQRRDDVVEQARHKDTAASDESMGEMSAPSDSQDDVGDSEDEAVGNRDERGNLLIVNTSSYYNPQRMLQIQEWSLQQKLERMISILGGEKYLLNPICTACGAGTEEALFKGGCRHPLLDVRVCAECSDRYGSTQFVLDTDGKEECCRLCAEEGELLICDFCPKTFCKMCIERNFGVEMWQQSTGTDAPWRCFVCDPSAVKPLQDAHSRLAKAESEVLAEEAADFFKWVSTVEPITPNAGCDSNTDPESDASPPHTSPGVNNSKDECAAEDESEDSQEEVSEHIAAGIREKHRRNIRPVMSDHTYGKKAQELQKKERARQKQLSAWEEESKNADCAHADQTVINPRRPMHEIPVRMSPKLAHKLKPHQLGGVRFMWENLVGGTVTDIQKGDLGAGCILAHSMGTGKTLQVITLLHTMLTRFSSATATGQEKDSAEPPLLRTALVVTPVNTLYNWSKEIHHWIGLCSEEPVNVFMLEENCKMRRRRKLLESWHERGGIMLIGYQMYRNLLKTEKRSNKQIRCFAATLQDPGPDVLVCDEGHLIKNVSSGIARTLAGARTLRRVALTGSPLQNSVMEYYCMVDFVRKGFLGKLADFRNRFEAPITNGQHVDSTEEDVKLMKQRAYVLHTILRGFVQRVGVEVLRKQLLPKHETVLCIRLSQLQRQLYQHFIRTFRFPGAPRKNEMGLFKTHSELLKVWNHPDLLPLGDGKLLDIFSNETKEMCYSPPDISSETVLADGTLNAAGNTSATDNNPGGPAQPAGYSAGPMNNGFNTPQQIGSGKNSDQEKQNSGRCLPGSNEVLEVEAAQDVFWYEHAGVSKWWADRSLGSLVQRSGKISVALSIFKQAAKCDEKTLMFSQSLDTLKLLESVLTTMSFTEGKEYLRIDGEIQARNRQQRVEAFNSSSKDSPILMIVSTRAGSLGINLVGASRVILLDMLWNPSYELQAVFRAYRYGQTRPVHVYRLLSAGTMEEKIYLRQITKQGLAARIVDEHQVARTFKASELENIYSLEPDDYWEKDDAEREKIKPRLVRRSSQLYRQTLHSACYPHVAKDMPNEVDEQTIASPNAPVHADNLEFNKQKDSILDNLYHKLGYWISDYFEHDILLQDVQEEQLDIKDRKAAWKAYEDALSVPADFTVPHPPGIPQAKTPATGGPSVAILDTDSPGFQQAEALESPNMSSFGAAGNSKSFDVAQQLSQLYRQTDSMDVTKTICPDTVAFNSVGIPMNVPNDDDQVDKHRHPLAKDVNWDNTGQDGPSSDSHYGKRSDELKSDVDSAHDAPPNEEASNEKAAQYTSLPVTKATNAKVLKELPRNVMIGLRVRNRSRGEGMIHKVYEWDGKFFYGLVFYGAKEEELFSSHDLIAHEIVFLSSHAPAQAQLPTNPDVAVQPA